MKTGLNSKVQSVIGYQNITKSDLYHLLSSTSLLILNTNILIFSTWKFHSF